jgi:hypothetical protein
MSPAEFLAPVIHSTRRESVLAAIYYIESERGKVGVRVGEIRDVLKLGRVRNATRINVSQVLAQSEHLVEMTEGGGNRHVWKLTFYGRNYVRHILSIDDDEVEAQETIDSLSLIVSTINDSDIADYVQESLVCRRSGALRACVVFLWSGGIRALQHKIMSQGHTSVNEALQRHDPKARAVKSVDDFATVKESVLLLLAQDVGLIDKNERQMLEHALDLRNKCGHPGKYRPGEKKVSAFVEDVIKIVFEIS